MGVKVTATRVARILQIIGLLLLIAYLALVGYENPNPVFLPLLIALPTAWTLAAALLLGFLTGWLSLSRRIFKLNRQNRVLHQRLIKAGLETEPAPQPRRSGPPLGPPRS